MATRGQALLLTQEPSVLYQDSIVLPNSSASEGKLVGYYMILRLVQNLDSRSAQDQRTGKTQNKFCVQCSVTEGKHPGPWRCAETAIRTSAYHRSALRGKACIIQPSHFCRKGLRKLPTSLSDRLVRSQHHRCHKLRISVRSGRPHCVLLLVAAVETGLDICFPTYLRTRIYIPLFDVFWHPCSRQVFDTNSRLIPIRGTCNMDYSHVAFCSSFALRVGIPKTRPLSERRKSTAKGISYYSASTAKATNLTVQESTKELLSPVLILPGLGNACSDYQPLADKLLSRGHRMVSIAPVRRWQWGLNAKGFFMLDYWRGELKPSTVLGWYFDKVDTAVAEIMEECNSTCHVNVLGHSAGGWLGRAYLAERAPSYLQVSTLLTLGTPHVAPPPGTIDQTRGILKYIEENCDISQVVSRFVCVAGRGTTGKPLGQGSISEFVAFLSYLFVCGRGNVDGDGVTPVYAACDRHGEAVICDNCDHSMLTSSSWYGSDRVLRDWVRYLS